MTEVPFVQLRSAHPCSASFGQPTPGRRPVPTLPGGCLVIDTLDRPTARQRFREPIAAPRHLGAGTESSAAAPPAKRVAVATSGLGGCRPPHAKGADRVRSPAANRCPVSAQAPGVARWVAFQRRAILQDKATILQDKPPVLPDRLQANEPARSAVAAGSRRFSAKEGRTEHENTSRDGCFRVAAFPSVVPDCDTVLTIPRWGDCVGRRRVPVRVRSRILGRSLPAVW